MVWTLFRRVAIVFMFLLGQRNARERGIITFVELNAFESFKYVQSTSQDSDPEMDWLTMVSVLLSVDIVLQINAVRYILKILSHCISALIALRSLLVRLYLSTAFKYVRAGSVFKVQRQSVRPAFVSC